MPAWPDLETLLKVCMSPSSTLKLLIVCGPDTSAAGLEKIILGLDNHLAASSSGKQSPVSPVWPVNRLQDPAVCSLQSLDYLSVSL